jgi:DNA-binding NarL/FixJ family response regulator
MSQISILLAEDHQVVREGIRALLGLDRSFLVVGEAQDGHTAVAMAQRLHPDVVLMDIAMPLLNGLEATRRIMAQNPAAKIRILTAHPDAAYLDGAIAAGAAGFLLKQTSATRLYRAIREVVAGRHPIGTKSGETSISARHRSIAEAPTTRLTSREAEVLQLIAEGKANKQAAALLEISTKTIEKHRAKVMAKLGIHDTAGLTRYAIAAGIIESSTQSTVLLPETR